MVEVAKRIGRNVPAEYSKIGSVVADLNTRLGLSGDTLEKVASQYLEAGRMLGQDVNIQKTTAAFSAFGIQGEQVSDAMDNLFRVSQATGVGMNELASSAQQAAPSMKLLGFSFEDTIAMVGAFDKAGLNSNAVMAALSKGLVTLAKKGEEPREAFKRVTGEIQGYLEKGNEAAALELASKIFGTRGATQFVEAMKSGQLAAGDMMDSIGATDDTILDLGQETSDAAEKWQLLKNRAEEALEPLGSAVFTWVGEQLDGLVPKLSEMSNWFQQNTWAIGALATLLAGVLVVGIYQVTAAIWAATAAMLANPVTWIVTGIGLLAAALYLLITNWDTVVQWVNGVWAATVAWLGSCWQGIIDGINNFGYWLSDFFNGIWESISNWIQEVLSFQWAQQFVDSATAPFQGLETFLNEFPDRAAEFLGGLTRLPELAAQWFNEFAMAIYNKLEDVKRWFTELPGNIVNLISGLGGMLARDALGGMNEFLNGFSEGWNSVSSFFGDIPNKIIGAIGDTGRILVESGRAIVDGFLKGIKGAWDSLTGWVRDGMASLRGLWPFSPAKWGPFSGHGYVTYSGEAIVTDFADSIAGQQGYLEKKARGVAQVARDIIPDSAGATINDYRSNSGSINVNTYNVDPYSTAVAVSQALRRLA